MRKIIFLLLCMFVLSGCEPETIIKYQCQNGQVVDSVNLCSEQICPECLIETVIKYQCQDGVVVDSIELCSEQICPECPTKKCVNITQPYTENESYQYTFKFGIIDDSTLGTLLEIDNWGTEQTTKIKNFEDEGGTFAVKHSYRTLKKAGVKEVSVFIPGGETKDLTTTFDTDIGEDVEVLTAIFPHIETRIKEVIKHRITELCNCS
ncbi:membrane lipoprotein lipid attachment site-containing protein [Candidatus Woesearchaeota archaeon]|nr:membrane lipoprotein lipid attachment site-containing protein [Candidatus Woesearchaeota archaeon]